LASKYHPIGEKELRVCLSDNVDRLRRLTSSPPIKYEEESMGAYIKRVIEIRYSILGMIWMVKDEIKHRGLELELDPA
jgi:hypothetical protein